MSLTLVEEKKHVLWKLDLEGFKSLKPPYKNVTFSVSKFTAESSESDIKDALADILNQLSDHTGLIIEIKEPNNECGAV